MQWLLVITILALNSGESYHPGDVFDALPFGVTTSEDACKGMGKAMTDVLNKQGPKWLSVYSCTEVEGTRLDAIAAYQKWSDPKSGGWIKDN